MRTLHDVVGQVGNHHQRPPTQTISCISGYAMGFEVLRIRAGGKPIADLGPHCEPAIRVVRTAVRSCGEPRLPRNWDNS
jgi:hypothetical protein